MNLTIRLEDGEVWACDDDGRSRTLAAEAVAQLAAWWETAPQTRPADARTAAVLSDLGQARMARPRSTGRLAAATVAYTGEPIALGPLTEAKSERLADVLDKRHSARGYGPLTLEHIATLLVRSARVLDWSSTDDGYQATHRPVPSAGARHPFDIHVVADRCVDGLAPGVYVLDATALTLVRAHEAARPGPVLGRLGEQFGLASPPATAIYLVAHLDRTLSRYPAGMSLIWRDAGALLQTLHLVASDIGLRSCIAGTCGSLIDEPAGPVIDMGCLVAGGSPRP